MDSNMNSKEDYGPQTIPWNLEDYVKPKSTEKEVEEAKENKQPEPKQKDVSNSDHSSKSISIDSIIEQMDNKDPELAKRIASALSKSKKITELQTTKSNVTVTTENGSISQNTIKQLSDDVQQANEVKETDILSGNIPKSSEGMNIPKFDSHLISEDVDNFGFTYHKLARDPNRNQPGRNMDHPGSTTLAITMIVKNETKVIKRLLDSIFPFLDYWVISDTGSTDGTPEMIINYFKQKNIPGELHYVPWKNFGFNRTISIQSTRNKTDFTILCDADFIINVNDPNFKNVIGKVKSDGHLIKYEGGLDYRQNLMVRTACDWKYTGVTHEFISAKDGTRMAQYNGITITHKADGGSRSNKFERDIELLENAIKENPESPQNGRYYFYLGQSYKDLGGTIMNKVNYKKRLVIEFQKRLQNPDSTPEDQLVKMREQMETYLKEIPEEEKVYKEYFSKSIPAYETRCNLGGWGEEVYFARLQIGLSKMRKGDDFWQYMPELLQAYMYRPTRLEALFNLVRACRLSDKSKLGYHLGCLAKDNKYPNDYLFIDRSIHDFSFWDELALCAHNIGDHELAYKLGKRIIEEEKFPESEKSRIVRNWTFFKKNWEAYKESLSTQSDTTLYQPFGGHNISTKNSNSIPAIGETPQATKSTPRLVDGASGPSSDPLDKSDVVAPVEPVKPAPSGYTFVRIKPEVKENRVAMIITNYNMPERSDKMVEYIKQHVEHPTDVILVDNGSDQQPPSKYTALHLGKNVQTCHGWLMGLHYADSLEIFEGFKYFAYNFIITSGEIVDEPNKTSQGDIISRLVKPLIEDSEVVGVHPALSTDSTTWWTHMKQRPLQKGHRFTNMIDNIFSVYRADWFNNVGRFEPSLTYAWGIDMETCYFARRDGKKILIDDEVVIRKVSDIGYKMNRMGMTGEDRFKNAKEQIETYFVEKYGKEKAGDVSRTFRVPEYLPREADPELITRNFKDTESGHGLLMMYLSKNKSKFADTSNQVTLLEIGATREEFPHQNSTYKLGQLARARGYHFITVDADTEIITSTKRMINTLPTGKPGHEFKFTPVNSRAEDYLPTFDGELNIVYIDGFDINLGPNHHNDVRKAKYRKYLDTEMENHKCYQMHLDAVKLVNEKMPVGGLICMNDVLNLVDFQYKGRTAVPYLLRSGQFKILEQGYNAILLEKIAGNPIQILDPCSRQLDEANKLNINSQIKKVLDPKKRYVVTLLGYTNSKNKHTNWYPWNRFLDVYRKMGYDCEWCELGSLIDRIGKEQDPRPRIFICWNQPSCVELLKTGIVHHYDVIIQKFTSLGKGMNDVNWGDDPKSFFKKWHWPIYQTVEKLLESGFNIYAFGCHTANNEDFPEKARIVKKLEKLNRLFWINWGSTVFNYEEIQNCRPTPTTPEQFKSDIAYVGSKWGKAGRGNTDQWDAFIQPVVDGTPNIRTDFHGSGFPGGMITDDETKQVLRSSKICPILHAPSWVAEEGIQDRFYTVFTAGRFGIVDNPGVLAFFDEDEVVVETDPAKYQALTKYFMEHPEEQVPYIEKVQHKIRTKYNLYVQWDNILTQIITDQVRYRADNYDFQSKVSQLHAIPGAFYENKDIYN